MNFLETISVNNFFNLTGQNCLVVDNGLNVIHYTDSTKQLISTMAGVKDISIDLNVIENIFKPYQFRQFVLNALNGEKSNNLLSLKTNDAIYSIQYFPFEQTDNERICIVLITYVKKDDHYIDLKELDFIVDNQSGGVISRHIHYTDGSIKYVYISDGIENLSGVSQAEVLENPNALFSGIYDENELNLLMESLNQSIENLAMFSHEWKIKTPDNKVKWLKGTGKPTLRDDGSIIFDSIVLDITDIKKRLQEQSSLRKELQRAKKQFESFTDNLPGVLGSLLFSKENEPKMAYISNGIEDLNGITVQEALNDTSKIWNTVIKEDLPGLQRAVEKAVKEFAPYNHIWRIKTTTGVKKWLSGKGAPRLMEDGSISLDTITLDITPLKAAEEKLSRANANLEKTLNEKNLLLKELQHRVKNSLNLISNYIYLKSLRFGHTDLKEFALELNNRIFTIAQSHEKMLDVSGKTSYSVSLYLETLVNQIIEAFIVNSDHYKVNYDIEDIKLNQDKSVMLGLIANEIISNTIKHAYKLNDMIRVSVSLKLINNCHHFIIRDFGRGFDPDNQLKKGIGLELIKRLAAYLEGKHDIIIDNGTIHKVTFPIN